MECSGLKGDEFPPTLFAILVENVLQMFVFCLARCVSLAVLIPFKARKVEILSSAECHDVFRVPLGLLRSLKDQERWRFHCHFGLSIFESLASDFQSSIGTSEILKINSYY